MWYQLVNQVNVAGIPEEAVGLADSLRGLQDIWSALTTEGLAHCPIPHQIHPFSLECDVLSEVQINFAVGCVALTRPL